MFLSALSPDPNYPGLMVCQEDRDQYDPYRLAPRRPDQIVLPFNRPDTPVNTHPAGLIQEAGDEFARLVIDALDLQVVAVEHLGDGGVYTARINLITTTKETSKK